MHIKVALFATVQKILIVILIFLFNSKVSERVALAATENVLKNQNVTLFSLAVQKYLFRYPAWVWFISSGTGWSIVAIRNFNTTIAASCFNLVWEFRISACRSISPEGYLFY